MDFDGQIPKTEDERTLGGERHTCGTSKEITLGLCNWYREREIRKS